MVLDYVKRNHQPPPPRQPKIAITLIVIIAAVVLPATLYLGHYHQLKKTHPQIIALPTKQSKSITQTSENKPNTQTMQTTTPTTQFAFYSLLPKMEVVIPQNTPVTTSTNTSEQQQSGTYLLQVASLQNPKDAERFKARLVTMGLMVSVQPYQRADGVIWNRVLVGPFTNLADAERQQQALHHDGLDSILLKAK
jgi:cell division protein FtsN